MLAQVKEEDGTELRRRAREKYDSMTVPQLQAMCEQSWLEKDGRREDLIKRLIHYEAETNEWPVR